MNARSALQLTGPLLHAKPPRQAKPLAALAPAALASDPREPTARPGRWADSASARPAFSRVVEEIRPARRCIARAVDLSLDGHSELVLRYFLPFDSEGFDASPQRRQQLLLGLRE